MTLDNENEEHYTLNIVQAMMQTTEGKFIALLIRMNII